MGITFEEAYRAVNNMVAQNEALLALREPLEKAKEVEVFLKSSGKMVDETKADIKNLESYREETVQAITRMKSDAGAKAAADIEELQKKFTQMREAHSKNQAERAKELEDEITGKKVELVSLEDSINSKHEELRTVTSELNTSGSDLRDVQTALAEIKNSIGG